MLPAFEQFSVLDVDMNIVDLGMGPHRNAIILNTILKTEHFKTEKNTGFQSFGLD